MNCRTFRKVVAFAALLPGRGSCSARTRATSSRRPTSVTAGSRTLPMAPLGPPNLWPRFRFQIPDGRSAWPPTSARKIARGRSPTPPCRRCRTSCRTTTRGSARSGRLPTIQVENAALRATFYPSLGGRMISLYDKRGRRELLFDNPVLQFANLAIRNAWFSGGVEWNGPLYGHSLLTCSPVFAGMVETPRGPLLRLYEFDRRTGNDLAGGRVPAAGRRPACGSTSRPSTRTPTTSVSTGGPTSPCR